MAAEGDGVNNNRAEQRRKHRQTEKQIEAAYRSVSTNYVLTQEPPKQKRTSKDLTQIQPNEDLDQFIQIYTGPQKNQGGFVLQAPPSQPGTSKTEQQRGRRTLQ